MEATEAKQNEAKPIKHKPLFIIYQIAIFLLIVASIVIVVLDLTSVIDLTKSPYIWIDFAMLLIFWIDYVTRFILAEQKGVFFRKNFLEFLSILPLTQILSFLRIFRAFRLIRLTRFFRILKFTRIFRFTVFLEKIRNYVERFFNTNGFIHVLYTVVLLLLISAFIISHVENLPFLDALWWTLVTCTTVGYGDITPVSGIGKTIAVFLMIVGVGFIGMLTGTITSFFYSKMDKKKSGVAFETFKEKYDSLTDEQKSTVNILVDGLMAENNKK